MSKPSFKINRELNARPKYANLSCHHCNRKHPVTILNIEGYMRDKIEPMCVNRGSCNKVMREQILAKVNANAYVFNTGR